MNLMEINEKNSRVSKHKKLTGLLVLFLILGISIGFNVAFTTRGPEVITREKIIETTPTFGEIIEEKYELNKLYEEIYPSVVLVESKREESSHRQGSGFIYSEDGYIITNQHVVGEGRGVRITFPDGKIEEAEIIGEDIYSDIAVLKVDREDLNPIPVGSTEQLNPGDAVVALGNPFGLEGTITKGIVSQKNRLMTTEEGFSIPNVIQTDAAINPGNSGGPLLNMKGEVIGINTAIRTETGTFVGIGFSVSVDTMQKVVPNLIDKGEYKHSWLGIRGRPMNPQIAEEINTNQEKGVLVSEVVRGGPADKAGLKEGTYTKEIWGEEINLGGDIIIEMNGEEIMDMNELISYIAQHTEPGEEVTLKIEREGEVKEKQLTMGERPAPGEVN